MKALIIDEPWISLILEGKKTWEMRKTGCKIRGRIALIRKGSGQVVGTADVVDSRPAISSRQNYAAGVRFHCIPAERQQRAFEGGWKVPWVLSNIRPLPKAVRYSHPSGAVIWVNLKPDVINQIDAQTPNA
jgi:ASCH domain-containing protein